MSDYDYIVVGAGTAGCVLGNRLTAGGARRVLVLEAGGSDRSPWIQVPIGYARTFNDPRYNWMYEAEPDPGLDNRRAHWPRGKVLGGSSSINAMIYVRGQPGDFDDWRAAGNPGWSWTEVLPYFRKLEDFGRGASEYHGTGGPVHVSEISSFAHPLCETFLAACAQLGIARTTDFNGAQPEGAGLWQVTIKDGWRVSAANAYLRPAIGRPNLALQLHSQVTRVLFDGKRATGVEYLHHGAPRLASARVEVLLAGGAVNTPQILELSGIGDGELLSRLEIPVIADSPAVGRGLQDHLAVVYFYRSRVPTLNDELAPFLGKVRAALRYALTRRGPLAMSVNQAGAFLRSRPELTRPNLHIYFNPASYSTTTTGSSRRLMNPDPFPGFLMSFNTCRPTSRGSIHIRSKDPLAKPAIVPNSLSTETDIRDVYDGARALRRIAAARPLAQVIESEREPGEAVHADADVLADFRKRAGTVFHASGTCAMGSDPRNAVLDERLRVRGVTGLRVVDASAFPNVTSGNTNAPTLMLAEKAADLILQDSRASQA
ncbi:MAG TPA: GMC family oxidoreductase N-terminal domain-containing protein [Steroidobacteraceae bacterium]|nr:GMC family oxidoreductase N-terminal domain-containing protein [Steroidobacteraceae bacterium]